MQERSGVSLMLMPARAKLEAMLATALVVKLCAGDR